MIIFAGNKERGFFCEDVAKKMNMECIFIKESLHIEEQANLILKYKDEAEAIVYDLEQYVDDPDFLVKWILKIKDALMVRTIIFAAGYSPDSIVIMSLYHNNVKNFIFPVYLAEQKKDLEAALEGYFETYGYEERGICFEEIEEKIEETKELNGNVKTIGLAGAVRRMGTTTQALQFIKYIQFCGHTAAYIQMNQHGWVQAVAENYSGAVQDKDEGHVTYMNVDMYYLTESLQNIKTKYEYLIYDYGTFSEHDFNKVSFLEKDLQVFVVGSKPGEFEKTYDVILSSFYSDVNYIFNFVAKTEQKDLYELMADKADKTYFCEESKDPFSFSNDKIYKKMLPVNVKETVAKKHKFNFFRKKGK
jgi:hypothetical protein